MRCHIDVRRASDSRLIYVTDPLPLHFLDHDHQLQVVVHLEGCVFESSGVYLVELYCDNAWVADTALLLREVKS